MNLFIYVPVIGHLDCFSFFVNNIAMTTFAPKSLPHVYSYFFRLAIQKLNY